MSTIERLTEIMLEWIEHTSTNKSNKEKTIEIETSFKAVFLELKQEFPIQEELKTQLAIMVNHISFQVDLNNFDAEEFLDFTEGWLNSSKEELSPELSKALRPYLFMLSQLPHLIAMRMTKLQERQTEVVTTFLEWSKNINNVSSG